MYKVAHCNVVCLFLKSINNLNIHRELVEQITVNPFNRILCIQKIKKSENKDALCELIWKVLYMLVKKGRHRNVYVSYLPGERAEGAHCILTLAAICIKRA